MISVVIPLYNKEKQLKKTLRSVFAQTFTDYEIVIVNDGSTDRSAEIVEALNDPRIRLIHQQNAGVSAARNRGIEESKGDYIAFLDADDEWKPDYLATQARMIEKYPDCDVFATNYEFRNEKGETSPTLLRKLKIEGEDGILDNYFEVASFSHPPICSISIVVSKKSLQEVGGFPVGIRLGEDLITWAKLVCLYKLAFSKKIFAIYNFSSQEKRLVPIKKPDKIDVVVVEFDKLINNFDIPYLKEYAARWHKIRMVTFVQLQQRTEARNEYKKLKKLIVPGKKDKLWFVFSFMPISIVRFFLKHKDKLK